MQRLTGIDIGTSSTKTVVFDESGKIISSASEGYVFNSPVQGWAEQSPEMWWGACERTFEKCGLDKKRALLGLSGQMHGLVCLDKHGEVLRPAIIWADGRTGRECAEINKFVNENRLFSRTLNRASTGFLFPSLLWIFRNEPDVAKKIAHVMLPKDYIKYKLTGEIFSEPSDACSTGAFDAVARKWLFELIEAFGVPREIFPEIISSAQFGGAGDNPAQSVGNGIIGVGKVSSNIGTAGQFCAPLGEPKFDSELRTNTFCHAADGVWYLLGAILSAGHSLQWLWKTILGERDYKNATEAARNSRPGSGGLLWCPWLNGDRMYNAPDARGVFVGLSAVHTRDDMVRAVMEGVVFSLKIGYEIAKGLDENLTISEVIASGGGAQSDVWRQIQADVYNLPVRTLETQEQACLGAAILGGVSRNVFKDMREGCDAMVKFSKDITIPNEKNAALYEELFSIWKEIFPKNKDIFAKLSNWRDTKWL